MRRSMLPFCARALSQAKSAQNILPRCILPLGEGAKRPQILASAIVSAPFCFNYIHCNID